MKVYSAWHFEIHCLSDYNRRLCHFQNVTRYSRPQLRMSVYTFFNLLMKDSGDIFVSCMCLYYKLFQILQVLKYTLCDSLEQVYREICFAIVNLIVDFPLLRFFIKLTASLCNVIIFHRTSRWMHYFIYLKARFVSIL